MRHPSVTAMPRHRQRGSILVPLAASLVVGIILLGSAQMGYLFLMKRELQKVADLAALTGMQSLGRGDAAGCAAAQAAARTSIESNRGIAGDMGQGARIVCGTWDPEGQPGPLHFAAAAGVSGFNAIHVDLNKQYPRVIPTFSRTAEPMVRAEAVASGSRQAAFSVGTALARADSRGVLLNLVKQVGLDLDQTALLDYERGLANVRISPAGLLEQLGITVPADITVGELNALLAAQASVRTLAQILDAVAVVGGADNNGNLATLQARVLNSVNVAVKNSPLNVKLGGADSGLFAELTSTDPASALGVMVDAVDLVATAIGVATRNHAVDVSRLNLNLGLLSVNVRASVIEPPSIGIGGIGTTAYTGQVRTFVELKAGPSSGDGNLDLLGLANLYLHLPIGIDVVSATGELTDLCSSTDAAGQPMARVDVRAEVGKICVGDIDPTSFFSTTQSCDANLRPKQLVGLSLLGTHLVSLRPDPAITTRVIPASGSATPSVALAKGESGQVGNEIPLGTTISNVVDTVLAALLLDGLDKGKNMASTPQLREQLARNIWTQHTTPTATNRVRLQQARDYIASTSAGLTGFIGTTANSTGGLLGSLLTLDIGGALRNVGNLVGGLLQGVGDLLGGLLSSLLGNPCTGGGLFGAGNAEECIKTIANGLSGTAGGGQPNVVTALLGMVLELLRGPLDLLGSQVLRPLLEDVIGLRVGVTDVRMLDVQCNRASLVY